MSRRNAASLPSPLSARGEREPSAYSPLRRRRGGGGEAVLILLLASLSFSAYQPSGLINNIPTDKPIVILTFDDGPKIGITEPILNILASENVKATFFLIGDNMVKYPDLVEQIDGGGHDVGNHTFDHIRLDNLNGDDLDYQLQETNRVFNDILGASPRFFRPPGGRFNNLILETIRKYGLIPIGWAINASDYLEGKERRLSESELAKKINDILAIVKSNLHPGAIILMHNGNDVSIKALPVVIRYVKSQGYQFKTLSEVL